MNKIKLVLIGAHGRLGSLVQNLCEQNDFKKIKLVQKVQKKADLNFSSSFDVVLDVSTPKATKEYLNILLKESCAVPYIIGCTGWTDPDLKVVYHYSKKACVVIAPNFSPAVNLLLYLLEKAASHLKSWGYESVLHEIHHKQKKDAPSGTAKAMLEKLPHMNTQVHSSRVSKVVGLHELKFIGPFDVLSFTHEAFDRKIFAYGALLAVKWVFQNRKTGLYSMKDVFFS